MGAMHFPRGRFFRVLSAVLVTLVLGSSAPSRVDAQNNWLLKLDALLRAPQSLTGHSRIVLQATTAGAR